MSDTVRDSLSEIPKAWPFEEARKVVQRLAASGKQDALFETGYGPSGLPHIGTFGEVARTSWVRRAFSEISGKPSRLLAFSDDMDGLRKVPDNIPNKDLLTPYLGKPLTQVPDPFGTHDSFGAHNNARLRAFLNSSASSTSSLRPPSITGPGVSTPRWCGCWNATMRSWRPLCRRCGRNGRRPTRRSCRCIPIRASSCRCRCSGSMRRPRR